MNTSGKGKFIEYRGKRFHCPFTDHFRRHTPEEVARMRESISAFGVRQPILLYTDATTKLVSILDGEGRLDIATNLDIDVEFRNEGQLDVASAFREACIYNDHRRMDAPEEIALRKAERVERVVAARAAGFSTRAIAEQEGVHHSTIQQDLFSVGGGPPTEKVIGTDGKSYQSTKPDRPNGMQPRPPVPPPMPLPEAPMDASVGEEVEQDPEPAPEPEESPEQVKDKVGHICPPLSMEAFKNLSEWNTLFQAYRALGRLIDRVSRLPGGEELAIHLQPTSQDGEVVNKSEFMVELRTQLACTMPWSVCPYCAGKSAKDCKGCAGRGWVSKVTWSQAEPQVQERLGKV